MNLFKLQIEVDADWLALNIYRMALERIVRERESNPWGFTGEEAGEIAESVLKQFPSSQKPK